MRAIGILGGMSWESSAQYYTLINRDVRERCGGIASAPLLMHSFDFAEIARLQADNQWERLGTLLGEAAAGLERAGAEAILIATNTMHLVAPQVEATITVPLLHIADPLAKAVGEAGHSHIGLLATRFIMEQPFYTGRLKDAGVATIIPEDAERVELHRIIFDELCAGIISESSRLFATELIESLERRGASAIALACTELMLLIEPQHSALPLFDTTALHCEAAVDFILAV
ncbi:MAG: aspartate/glutamate racemase family protein [Pseudomonadota bacterium]